MSMTQASSDYFDRVAGEWDTIRAGYFTEAVREAAIGKAYLREDMRVADIGAGTGFMAAGLAPLAGQVFVVDGSPAMLDVARKNLQEFNNLDFRVGDGGKLPLEDASLDAVFANMYLHHCPDPLSAIREMARVLKPGGRLVITDMDSHEYAWLRDEMADVWQGFARSQVMDWFQQAGLVNRIVDGTGQSCSAESQAPALVGENGQKASISIFLAVGTRSVANIKARVIDNYTQAISGTSRTNCCSTDTSQEVEASATCGCSAAETDLTVTNALGYPVRDLQEVPGEATEVSFGCGNPLAIANLKPGEFVLDIGSGGGIDAFLAARKVGAAGKVIGVDMTPAMIERSTKSAEKGGFQQVEFRLGQAENLPVEDGLVDVILSNCVINLTEDKGRVFGEAYRVLKEGGRLEVSDMVTSGSFSAATRGNLDEWSGCVAGAIPAGEYLDLIAQAGFKDIQTRRSSVTEQSGGVEVYSLLVSAVKGDRKPSRFQLVSPVENQTDCGCGSGSGTACCG